MRIGVKLIAAFLTIAALVGIVGYLSAATNREIRGQVQRISRSAIVKVVNSTEMALAANAQHSAVRQLVAEIREVGTATPDDRNLEKRIAEQTDAIRRDAQALQASLDKNRSAGESLIRWATQENPNESVEAEAAEMLRSLDRLEDAIRAHQRLIDELVDLAQADADAAEAFLNGRLQEHFSKVVLPLINTHKSRAEAEFTSGIRNVERELVTANYRNNWITIAALLTAGGLGLIISRSIARPLGVVRNAASQIGQGRLDTRIQVITNDEIGVLAQAFNRMVEQLEEKTVSKAYVDNVVRSLREMLIVADSDARIRQVNPATLRELGTSEAELVGRPLASLFETDTSEGLQTEDLPDALFEGFECRFRSEGGEAIPVYCSASEMRDEREELQGIVCVALNIAERKAAEQRLRASLREKEVLLKEIHHRVKNNLQVISSLLSLQMQEVGDSETVRLFRESQNRIRSMALIHEQLYESENLSQIDFAEYVGGLASHLRGSLGTPGGAIALEVDAFSVPLPLEKALPCGMIVNELVSNAMEHAFPDGGKGSIRICFRVENDDYVLEVSDNGVGLPPDRENKSRKSLGLRVVDALVRQVHGEMEVTRDDGTCYAIRFPKPADCEERS